MINLMFDIAEEYIKDNANQPHRKRYGLASARQMKTELKTMKDQRVPAELDSVKEYLFRYIRTAKVEENKASGHRNSSLIVKMMHGAC